MLLRSKEKLEIYPHPGLSPLVKPQSEFQNPAADLTKVLNSLINVHVPVCWKSDIAQKEKRAMMLMRANIQFYNPLV